MFHKNLHTLFILIILYTAGNIFTKECLHDTIFYFIDNIENVIKWCRNVFDRIKNSRNIFITSTENNVLSDIFIYLRLF